MVCGGDGGGANFETPKRSKNAKILTWPKLSDLAVGRPARDPEGPACSTGPRGPYIEEIGAPDIRAADRIDPAAWIQK